MSTMFENVLHRIRIAFVVAALAMAVFGVASYKAIDGLASLAIGAVNTQDKLILLAQLNASLSRSQTALRDYVLSGRKNDLDLFQIRAWDQKSTVEMLGSPPVLPEQDELERRVSERVQMQYEIAAARGRGTQADAVKLLDSIRSEEAERELADLLLNMRSREESKWWSSHAVTTAKAAQRVVVAAGGLLVAMFLWAFWLVRRYERERRRVTRLLDQTEAMNRALAENMADGMVTLGEDLTVLAMNRAAQEMLGYGEKEVVGRPASHLAIDYPGREQLLAQLRANIEQRVPFRIAGVDMMVRRKDGRMLPVQVSLNDVHLCGARCVTALMRDMSSIRAATDATRASEQHLREITDTIPMIVVELDTEQRFRFMNRACAEFFGMPGEEADGRPYVEVLGKDLHELHASHVERVLRGGSARYEVTAADSKGKVGTYDMHLFPRRAAGSGEIIGVYAFGSDITALKRIDRMKTEFISTVSHELRTPLTSIRGSLGLMSAGVAGKLPEAAANLVSIAQNNCDRLIRLINDILDSEKIESGGVQLRHQVVELTPVVRKALTDNEGFAQQHHVHLRMYAPAAPLAVRVDVDRLLQVLTNLISNAVKFSPAHAEIDVRVSSMHKMIRVEVSDRGPGIPVEFQRRIFQKFSQADSSDSRAKGGTGLGLNISRTLVEKMGGQIGFTSTPGDGATFFFELPRHDVPGPAGMDVPRPPALLTRKRLVLHVEGDGDIRAIVSNLAGEHATCISAGSLRDARERLRETPFDLILLEPELEDGSGWDLLEDQQQSDAAAPVIVFSAGDAEPPDGAHVAAVLVKAQTTEERLVREIRRVLRGETSTIPTPLEL